MPLHSELVEVVPFVAEVVRGSAATERIDVDVDPGLRVDADRERLHQV